MGRHHRSRGALLLCIFLLLPSPLVVCCRDGGVRKHSKGRRGNAMGVALPKKVPEDPQGSLTEFEALWELHRHLDDDEDGELEIKESEEFISEELNQRSLSATKGARFHRGNAHVTVDDLWQRWHHSEVYNWSCGEVVQWLVHTVQLPQYKEAFTAEEVNGTTLPRMAMNTGSFLQSRLKITSSTDRKKLQLRAMDLVLFGPPTQLPRNWVLDAVLISFALACALGLWWSCRQKHAAERQMDHLLLNMKRAEEELRQLQAKLENEPDISPRPKSPVAGHRGQARDEPDGVNSDMPMRSFSTPAPYMSMDILRAEIEALLRTKSELESEVEALQAIPDHYYQLLQQTYRMEKMHWEEKKRNTEMELNTARTECEKLHRKKSFLSSLRVVNSTALHDTDHKINCAIITLKEVTEGLEEFNERWRNIEYFSSIPISRTGANHNGDSDSLPGDKRGVSQERVSVGATGTAPAVRRRIGRVSSGAKLSYGRPPSLESTKSNNSSQDSSHTEWSIGGESLHSKSPEVEYTYSEHTTYHRYSLDEAPTDSTAHRVVGSQSSLPVPHVGSEDTAVLGWYRSSAPNLREMPLKFVGAGSHAKKLSVAKSDRINVEDLPPIAEVSPVPSRSYTESQNGNRADSHFKQ